MQLFTINQCWSSIMFIHYGYIGVHADDTPPHDDGKMARYGFLAQVFYTPILSMVKTSVLACLRSLGGQQRTGVRRAIHTLIVLNACQMIAVLGVTIFQCTPVSLGWSETFQTRRTLATCINPGIFMLSVASWNIFTDFLVLMLPYRIFFVLRINKRMRNALVGVFMLGLVVTVFSAVRFYYVYRVFFDSPADPTYSLGYVLSAVESNLAIVAASVPALWPLARRWFPSMDDRLGINDRYQPDIEVQSFAGGAELAAGVDSPLKVKVTWTRAVRVESTPNTMMCLDSPVQGVTPRGSVVGCGQDEMQLPSWPSKAAEGCGQDGTHLPSCPAPSKILLGEHMKRERAELLRQLRRSAST